MSHVTRAQSTGPPPMIYGFDSRYWNGVLPAANPFKYAFVKFTEATGFATSNAVAQWNSLKAGGLLRGPYHFYRNASNPEDQAAYFRANVGSDIGELPPVLDLEDTASIKGGEMPARVQRCLAEIEKLFGKRPMVYSAAWWWNPWMGNQPWVNTYERWVANYTVASTPLLPIGWTTWDVWQFKGDVTEPGFNAKIDWNRTWTSWFDKYNAPPPEKVTLTVRKSSADDLHRALHATT